jgi:uncharacterized protein YlxW (UPF0749 family)
MLDKLIEDLQDLQEAVENLIPTIRELEQFIKDWGKSQGLK